MKKTISLAKVLYKVNKNDSSNISKNKKLFLYVLLVAYILFIFVSFWNMFLNPLKNIQRQEAVLPLVISMSSIFVVMTCVLYVINVLFFSKDIESIMPFPFKPRQILFAKFLNIYISEILLAAMVFIPGIISYAQHIEVNILFFVYAIIVCAFLPVVPILFVSALYIIAMQFLKITKYQNVFRSITTILILVFILSFEFGLNSNLTVNGNYDSQYVYKTCQSFEEKMPYYLDVANDSLTQFENLNGTISILWFIIINILSVFAIMFCFDKLYIKGVNNNLSAFSSKRKLVDLNEFKSNSCFVTLVNKDLKKLFRNVNYFMQCVLPIFIFPIIILITIVYSSDFSEMASYTNGSDVLKLVYATLIIQSFLLMNHISVTAVSRDGISEALFMKSLPIGYGKQIKAKVVPSVLIGSIALVISILFCCKVFELKLLEIIYLFVIGVLLNFIHSYLLITIDLHHPKLYWTTEMAVVKQNINILYAVLVTVGTILLTAFLGGMMHSIDVNYYMIFSVFICMITIIIFNSFIRKKAYKFFDLIK